MSDRQAVAAIRRFLADRSTQLGTALEPDDVTVILAPPELQTDLLLFRARYGDRQREASLSGIIIDDGPPELQPGVAMKLVFDRWLAAGPAVASPDRLARAVWFLLDPAERSSLILTADDVAKLGHPEWSALVHSPMAADGGAEHGIVLWRVSESGPTELRVTRGVDGEINTTEHRVQR
jgi:hypothetical protein